MHQAGQRLRYGVGTSARAFRILGEAHPAGPASPERHGRPGALSGHLQRLSARSCPISGKRLAIVRSCSWLSAPWRKGYETDPCPCGPSHPSRRFGHSPQVSDVRSPAGSRSAPAGQTPWSSSSTSGATSPTRYPPGFHVGSSETVLAHRTVQTLSIGALGSIRRQFGPSRIKGQAMQNRRFSDRRSAIVKARRAPGDLAEVEFLRQLRQGWFAGLDIVPTCRSLGQQAWLMPSAH